MKVLSLVDLYIFYGVNASKENYVRRFALKKVIIKRFSERLGNERKRWISHGLIFQRGFKAESPKRRKLLKLK